MRLRYSLIAAAGFAAAALGFGAAVAEERAADETPFQYVVIEENARIPFGASQINSYRLGRDGSLLLRARGDDWYRATLFAPCARDLRWEQEIGLGDRGGSIDRFSFVVVDGQQCSLRSLDRIEDPEETEAAADAAAATSAS